MRINRVNSEKTFIINKKIIALVTLCLALFSCQKEDPVVTTITLPQTISLDIGSTQKITPTHLPSDLPPPVYTWQSSDVSIFTVDNQGNISAIGVGEATLTVKFTEANLTATSRITVLPINASSLEIEPKSATLIIGNSLQLEGTVHPDNTTDKTLVWKSEDKNVATVTENGLVEAVGLGKTRIIATSGSATGYCEITVEPILAEKVIISRQSINMLIGSTETLTATIEPENTTHKEIVWNSENEEIATVTEGVISGIGVGKTIITATCGNASASCEVTVEPIKVTGINLSNESFEIEMTDRYQLTATILPTNATNQKVNWSSDNPDIAEVDESGWVTGISEGTTTIHATTEDGNYSASCDVTVTLKGLILTKEHLQMLPETTELIHVLYSTNENAYLEATWTSSNPNVATITGDGRGTNSAVIEAKDLGTTLITATSADGSKKASCLVEVVEITNFIDLSFITYSIVNLNGFIYGDIYSKITNNSKYPIELSSCYIYDGNTGRVVARQDPTEVTALHPGESTNLGTKFNSVYYPIFIWNFTWNNRSYSIQHQYLGSTRSTQSTRSTSSTGSTGKKLFKIEPLDE